MTAPADPERLMAVLLQFTAVPSLRVAQQLVQNDRELLLSPAADAMLEIQVNAAGRGEMLAAIWSRRHLLRRCREVGVERAFAEARSEAGDEDDDLIVPASAQEMATLVLQFVTASSWAASKRVVLAHEVLLTDRADAAFDLFIEGAETAGDDAAEVLRRHQQLLRRCREVGVDAAFVEIDGPDADDELSPPELMRMYLTAPSSHDAESLLTRHPRLLSPEVVALVEAFVGRARAELSPEVARGLEHRLDILRRSAEIGVEAALAERRGGAPSQEDLMAVLHRALNGGAADVLKAHPELLLADDDTEVDRLIATASGAGNAAMATQLEQTRAFVSGSRALRGVGGTTDAAQLTVLPVIHEFVRADSWAGSRRVVEAHPELLEAAADRLLGRLISAAEHVGDRAAADMFTAHRRLLGRARESGVAAAFAEVGGADEDGTVAEFVQRFRDARAEMAELGTPDDLRVSVLGRAAMTLVERHRRTGDADAIVAAVECLDGVVEEVSPTSPDYPHHLNYLAGALTARYAVTGDVADLVRARDVTRAALATRALGRADKAGTLTNLGNVLADLGAHTGEPGHLGEAIVVYETAVDTAGERAENRTGLLANLAEGLRRRFDLDGAAVDLDGSIAALRDAIAAAGHGDPMAADLTSNLAVSLIDRFELGKDRSDLDEAVAIYERAIPRLAASDDHCTYNGGFAKALVRRFDRDGDARDLDRAEAAYRSAAATAADAGRLTDCLSGLAGVLRKRFGARRNRRDLDAAIAVFEQAAAAAPSGGEAGASLLAVLASAVVERYDVAGDPADLDTAIGFQERALALTPVDSPDWPGEAASMGNRYLARSDHTSGTADLDAAVGWGEQAVRATPAGSDELPRHLANLGISLRSRYQVTGDVDDLDRSFAAHARAVATFPAGSGDAAKHLVGWGQALLVRFEQAGESADLARAVDTFRKAVAAATDDPGTHRVALTGLAGGLRVRFANTRQDEDLAEAIQCYQRVLDDAPATAPDRAGWTANLANGLDDAYDDAGHDPADLDRGIALYRESLALSSDAWRGRRDVSVSLAESLLKRRATDQDLAESIRRCEEAVREAGDRTPGMPRYLATLAKGLRLRDGEGDSAAATALYRRCSEVAAATSPRSVIVAANTWGDWATGREGWAEAAEAFGHGVAALRALVGKQGPRHDKEEWLRGSRRLAAGLAYARAMTGDAEGAVVALERGRAVLLAEELATGDATALSYPSIAQHARTAPIAYIAAAEPGGVALIAGRDGAVTRVLLPGLSADALRERMLRYAREYRDWLAEGPHAAWDVELDDLGRWLWTTVMGPVLSHLPPGTSELVLVPGGHLSMLPLHSAWVADPAARTGRRYALDEVCISYSANAAARGASVRIAATTAADSVLVVEDPLLAGGSTMPTAKAEADHVVRTFAGSSPAEIVHLRRETATRSAVAAALGRHPVLHLCCHGVADVGEPLHSGLLMAGGERLTVADVMRQRSAPARLAVLSACESAMPGVDIPDEVVGFPTSLANAGVAGVIGTQWVVPDRVAAAVMKRFYTLWRVEGLAPAEALRQTQRRVRDRTAEPHPSGWAAITYTGA